MAAPEEREREREADDGGGHVRVADDRADSVALAELTLLREEAEEVRIQQDLGNAEDRDGERHRDDRADGEAAFSVAGGHHPRHEVGRDRVDGHQQPQGRLRDRRMR